MRRKTVDRLLADQQRAHHADRRQLLAVIDKLNDRLMFMAGRQYDVTPLQAQPDVDLDPDDDDLIPDLEQLPDDLADDPY